MKDQVQVRLDVRVSSSCRSQAASDSDLAQARAANAEVMKTGQVPCRPSHCSCMLCDQYFLTSAFVLGGGRMQRDNGISSQPDADTVADWMADDDTLRSNITPFPDDALLQHLTDSIASGLNPSDSMDEGDLSNIDPLVATAQAQERQSLHSQQQSHSNGNTRFLTLSEDLLSSIVVPSRRHAQQRQALAASIGIHVPQEAVQPVTRSTSSSLKAQLLASSASLTRASSGGWDKSSGVRFALSSNSSFMPMHRRTVQGG